MYSLTNLSMCPVVIPGLTASPATRSGTCGNFAGLHHEFEFVSGLLQQLSNPPELSVLRAKGVFDLFLPDDNFKFAFFVVIVFKRLYCRGIRAAAL